MKANPGGNIDTKWVIGRADIIELLWGTLEQQSVLKTAERRIGKTTISKKMQAEPPEGWFSVLQDLEQYHTAEEFAVSVYLVVDEFLSTRGKVARRAKEFIDVIRDSEIGGTKISKRQSSWKEILTKSIADLTEERSADDQRLVFL